MIVTGVVIAQVLLTLVIGLWLGAKFAESPVMGFFGRNDWFVGVFLVLIGYMNFLVYTVGYVKNLNMVLIVIGMILIMFSLLDLVRN
ncbi:hypothetical protein JXB27_03190 [Candidatus Woesearchaeota archaeon]|nr:hypothetical protein [Candidatus Woesearchaeota archaeon]